VKERAGHDLALSGPPDGKSSLLDCDAAMTEEMLRYYARRAGEYERVYEIPAWQPGLAELRRRVAMFTGRRVFEVACGTGYWTEILAGVAESVHATDLNAETLALARARPYPRGNVTLEAATRTRGTPGRRAGTPASQASGSRTSTSGAWTNSSMRSTRTCARRPRPGVRRARRPDAPVARQPRRRGGQPLRGAPAR